MLLGRKDNALKAPVKTVSCESVNNLLTELVRTENGHLIFDYFKYVF